jgi:hypothetical protein
MQNKRLLIPRKKNKTNVALMPFLDEKRERGMFLTVLHTYLNCLTSGTSCAWNFDRRILTMFRRKKRFTCNINEIYEIIQSQ